MKIQIVFATLFFVVGSIHSSEVAKLTLSASATMQKPSDELQMKIGVVTLGFTAEEALSENSYKMEGVVANLEAMGLSKDDYETSHFAINPTYTPYPKDPPLNWRQTINGYEVTNTILIRTPKLEMAGKIIDGANKAGANSITEIRFGLRNARDYWSEVLAMAGSNAVNDARAIAMATGVRLTRVLSINLNHTQVTAPQLNFACLARGSESAQAMPPIEPGEVSLSANISIVYEIE